MSATSNLNDNNSKVNVFTNHWHSSRCRRNRKLESASHSFYMSRMLCTTAKTPRGLRPSPFCTVVCLQTIRDLKTRNVFKKDNRRQILLTENLEWLLPRISGQLFWPTLLESKWYLQIPLRRFITCVMTYRGSKNVQLLSCTQSTCSSK